MSKYLNENGVKILWDKTKEKIAEVTEELGAKVDEIQTLSLDEINEILNPVVLITFSLRGQYTYEAVEGMTWREFVESEYNTNHMYPLQLRNNGEGFEYIFCAAESMKVDIMGPDSVIVNGKTYGLQD